MSTQLAVPRLSIIERIAPVLEAAAMYGGIACSCAIGISAVLDYAHLVHTGIGAFIVDQIQNGEARFNANADIHGDWGNAVFAVLATPMFIGMYLAAFISSFRSP